MITKLINWFDEWWQRRAQKVAPIFRVVSMEDWGYKWECTFCGSISDLAMPSCPTCGAKTDEEHQATWGREVVARAIRMESDTEKKVVWVKPGLAVAKQKFKQ